MRKTLCGVFAAALLVCAFAPGAMAMDTRPPTMERDGEPLATLTLPRINARQYSVLYSYGDGEQIVSEYTYESNENETEWEANRESGYPKPIRADSIEQAQERLPFPVALSSMVPEGYTLDEIILWEFPNGEITRSIRLHYGDPEDQRSTLGYMQEYVGLDAVFFIDTDRDIGTVHSDVRTYLCLSTRHLLGASYELRWMEGGFGFQVNASDFQQALSFADAIAVE